jgi:hypothetical protein
MERQRKKIDRVHTWLSGSESTKILQCIQQEKHKNNKCCLVRRNKGVDYAPEFSGIAPD